MLFDSPVYLAFLATVAIIYWKINPRGQNSLLLIASYLFYGWWDWRFLGLIMASTIIDFHCARYIDQSKSPRGRKYILALSVILNLSLLGFFKYFNFFIDSFAELLQTLGVSVSPRALNILLPPGISFYTFQALAYMVDVYHRRIRPTKSLLDYGLFISLFPHLIAGPIQRPSHLLPQVEEPRTFNAENLLRGLILIIYGLFQKGVVADNCSLLANAAFDGKFGDANLAVLMIGAYAFAWQIYGDFAGYSNIARGSAQMLGFHFMVNFRQPYLATSLQDFWRRWHISLSSWLRDYLYIPLGGSRDGALRTNRNILLTMVLGGLWHGANWTFLIWGAIHGIGQCIARILSGSGRAAKFAKSPAQTLVTWHLWVKRICIFHVVCFSWVFFRATSVGGAFRFLGGLRALKWAPEYGTALIFLAMFTIPMFAIDLINERRSEEYLAYGASPYLQVGFAGLIAALTLLFSGNSANAFIYFQF